MHQYKTRMECACKQPTKVFAMLLALLNLLLQLPRQLFDFTLCLGGTSWTWRCYAIRQQVLGETCRGREKKQY